MDGKFDFFLNVMSAQMLLIVFLKHHLVKYLVSRNKRLCK